MDDGDWSMLTIESLMLRSFHPPQWYFLGKRRCTRFQQQTFQQVICRQRSIREWSRLLMRCRLKNSIASCLSSCSVYSISILIRLPLSSFSSKQSGNLILTNSTLRILIWERLGGSSTSRPGCNWRTHMWSFSKVILAGWPSNRQSIFEVKSLRESEAQTCSSNSQNQVVQLEQTNFHRGESWDDAKVWRRKLTSANYWPKHHNWQHIWSATKKMSCSNNVDWCGYFMHWLK